ncbi:MAG: type II toxin-antitoxin system VapC family toxin [Leptospiraceae bacterium]|nr:type II toxin-antitoxin system VapC family toxin [Leptospiraceae bacterium]
MNIVINSRFGQEGENELDNFIKEAEIEIVEVSVEQIKIARQAFKHYGKGRHPAGLNFGDCFAYSLAKYFNEPLLYKGDDFSKTDIISISH